MARFGISIATSSFTNFPYGTLICNILGSLLIGVFAGLWVGAQRATYIAYFLITGICGGFTTMSTFSLQTLELMEAGKWGLAFANVFASIVGCITATFVGAITTRSIVGARCRSFLRPARIEHVDLLGKLNGLSVIRYAPCR